MTQITSTRPETGRIRVQTENLEPSQTVQSDVNRSEIAHIMRQYDAQGVFTSLRQVDMTFRDVSEFEDYADMMLQSREAEAAFMRLPSKLREVFNHDHMVWLDAAHDPILSAELRPKLEKLGYLEAVTAPAPTPPPPAAAPPAAPPSS